MVIGTNLRILLAGGEAIGWGVDVIIVVEDVTNPAPGSYALCVGTSNTSPICSDAGDADVVATYELTMALDPAGGGTATDMSDESPYEAGTVVSIKAEANAGYRFVNWTAAPEVVFADSNAAETTFIMPDEAVTITAKFEPIPTYTLTMAAAPVPGGVATDETGASASEMLPSFFMQEIDRVAMAEGLFGSDEYLEAWVWSAQKLWMADNGIGSTVNDD